MPALACCVGAWSTRQWIRDTPKTLPEIASRDAICQTFLLQLTKPSWNNGGSGACASMQYVGSGGYGTDNKNTAILWTVINGQLVSLTEGGYLSFSSGHSNPLAPSPRVQSIFSNFAVESDGTLTWSNSEFSQGSAKFCQQQYDGLIVSYSGATPPGCVESGLRAVAPSSKETAAGAAGTASPPSNRPGALSPQSNSPEAVSLPVGQPEAKIPADVRPDVVSSPTGTSTEDSSTRTVSDENPSSTTATSSCQVQTGTSVPTFNPNLASPSAQDVVDATIAWLNDVCTVDSFLNSPVGGPTSLETVIAFAIDEPTQLTTLSSIPNLSAAGKAAAAALEVNFPPIPANLYNVQNGTATVLQATTAINLVRCCVVLPSIGTLVQEAADAVGAFRDTTVPQPVYPVPCASIDCSKGASPGTTS